MFINQKNVSKYISNLLFSSFFLDILQYTSQFQIPIPEMINKYNESMGGVDQLDAMVGAYRIPFRNKKWWCSFFTWSLSVSAVNAWRLRMSVTGNQESYLCFLRELVIEMFSKHGAEPFHKRILSIDQQATQQHWTVHTD